MIAFCVLSTWFNLEEQDDEEQDDKEQDDEGQDDEEKDFKMI